MKALLALEDGRTFECRSFTGSGETFGEVVFNTSMSGYQEVLTDPSYRGQMVVMTYPLIGNYGVNPDDVESDRIHVSAFIMKEYQEFPSNFRSTQTLQAYLRSQKILGIDSLDTRALTRHIRTAGAMRAVISTQDLDTESLVARANQTPKMEGRDLASSVTTDQPYFWENNQRLFVDKGSPLNSAIWEHRDSRFAVVAFDFGIKYNILRGLERAGCEVLVVPAATSAASVRALAPDGIFLSNGPGDPEPVDYAAKTIKDLLGYKPMFGICLGIQLLGRALGGKTYKLKFGHHGSNQPVQNLTTRRVEVTSQNHGFAVDQESLDPDRVEVTHINLNDNTVEGFRHKEYPMFAVQYHPEAAPGPNDANYLFCNFVELMKENK
ncbi:MAG: glutamine-hydrolyzing carbamoyl-phosphate synthase small subunit [Desulfobacteraceae bacterium]|nr:glutamine-hydrolyzing carbamoyl-phosphate synthase small subunit [Desulfobacteraceae bacterium]MBC2757495.1 glutamine-hydrolyzing carbamoyl-phosphate synthase small subunit [Desulfobacteraceae bacterium]